MSEDSNGTHRRKVESIAARVRDQASRGRRIHITRKSGHHVVPLPDDPRFRDEPIDISPLNEILEIDVENRRCVAEPGVSFSRLIDETLKHGLIPTVVPELEGITLGGAVAGCSIEAMSYKYGGFHDSCSEYDLITGDGRVITCSPDSDPSYFNMVHGSYGTLAILSRLTFRLVDAKPFVQMEYRSFEAFAEFEAEMHARCDTADFDFVDGIIHSPTQHGA